MDRALRSCRWPIARRLRNMAPEYGATCGIFPVDAETLRYLRLTGRSEEQIALVEAYYREQGMFHTADAKEAEYSATIALDLATVEPSVAGPKRPQDRVQLSQAAASFKEQLPALLGPNGNKNVARQMVRWEGEGGTCVGVRRRDEQCWVIGAGGGASDCARDYDS